MSSHIFNFNKGHNRQSNCLSRKYTLNNKIDKFLFSCVTRSDHLKHTMDYNIKKWDLSAQFVPNRLFAQTLMFSFKLSPFQDYSFFKWYFYSFLPQSLKREAQSYQFLMWFTAMLLKQISSWERATEVTHRRAVVFEMIPGAGRQPHRTSFTHCASSPCNPCSAPARGFITAFRKQDVH